MCLFVCPLFVFLLRLVSFSLPIDLRLSVSFSSSSFRLLNFVLFLMRSVLPSSSCHFLVLDDLIFSLSSRVCVVLCLDDKRFPFSSSFLSRRREKVFVADYESGPIFVGISLSLFSSLSL